MLHSYTFEKLGRYYTRVVGFNDLIIELMRAKYLRYDSGNIDGQAMFVLIDKEEYKKFHDEYNVIEIDNIEEFKLVAKIIR